MERFEGTPIGLLGFSRTLIRIPDPARQNQLTATVVVPLETPPSNIPAYTELAVKELFALFGGKEFSRGVIEEYASKTIGTRY